MRRGKIAVAGMALAALIVGTTTTADAKPVQSNKRDFGSGIL